MKNPEAPAVRREAKRIGAEGVAVTQPKPKTVQMAADLVHEVLGEGQQGQCSVFVIEAWVGKRWRPIAQSDYEAPARRLFNQASYVYPVETLLRLRRGSDVLIKMPADGLGNLRE